MLLVVASQDLLLGWGLARNLDFLVETAVYENRFPCANYLRNLCLNTNVKMSEVKHKTFQFWFC